MATAATSAIRSASGIATTAATCPVLTGGAVMAISGDAAGTPAGDAGGAAGEVSGRPGGALPGPAPRGGLTAY